MEKPTTPPVTSEELARIEAGLRRPASTVTCADLVATYGLDYMNRMREEDYWIRPKPTTPPKEETIDVECVVLDPNRLEA